MQGGSYGSRRSDSGQRGGRQTGAVANSGPAPLPLVCQVRRCGTSLACVSTAALCASPYEPGLAPVKAVGQGPDPVK